MIKTQIVGDNGKRLDINEEGQAPVVVHPHPPRGESINAIPFAEYFTDSNGSEDMLVSGSVAAPIPFCIRAIPDKDIYIKTVSVLIVDASATLSKFGNLTALTNGVKFSWNSQDQPEVIINESIKTNFEFVRLAGGNPSFGDGANVFRAQNVLGPSEAFIPFIDLSITFGLPWGVRLRAGTKDELCFTVRDNISAMDGMNIYGYGIKF